MKPMFGRKGLLLRDDYSVRYHCILLLAALVSASSLSAQTAEDVIHALAPQVAEWFPSRATVSVECNNRSQAKEAEFVPICRGMTRELQRLGLQAGPAGNTVTLTASETATGKLVSARAVSGDRLRVAITPWSTSVQTPQSAWRVRVDRTPVIENPTPVLDFAVLHEGAAIAVLEPAAVSTYNRTPAGWELTRRELLPLTKPPSRDPRGRLLLAGGTAVAAYLPGTVCTSQDISTQPFTCNGGESAWTVAPGVQVRWVPGRNVMQWENANAYTVAAIAPDRLLVSSVEGPLRLQGLRGEQLGVFTGFGSDVASVQLPCGAFAIVTRAGDGADADRITAVDVGSGRMEPAGPGLTLPGPVTALWPSDDGTELHAVVRNAGTGVYEVSRLAIHCVQ
jgi:hypothetical protein